MSLTVSNSTEFKINELAIVAKNGKIYLIDTNMNVQFTGNMTKHKNCTNTIIDGEHVLHDKNGNFINLFLCFDIYFKNVYEFGL